jgi:hypothetical protein
MKQENSGQKGMKIIKEGRVIFMTGDQKGGVISLTRENSGPSLKDRIIIKHSNNY